MVRGPSVSQILELHWDYPPGPPAPVTKDEGIFYNNDKVPIDAATLRYRLVNELYKAQATHKPFPEVHIRGDKTVRFQAIGRVILACQEAGILKVGFLTEPQGFENSNPNAVSSVL